MNTPLVLSIYSQDRLDDETFLAHFVARRQLTNLLLGQLQRQSTPNLAEHQLIIGQRGMGKTSLLRRIAIGIKQDPDLQARYLPLRFREEQYNVLGLADFWRNCLDGLADWCEENGNPEIAERIDEFLSGAEIHNPAATGQCFQTEVKSTGRRALLLVDNLNLITDNLSEDDNWTLRGRLQEPGGPVMIGASTQGISQAAEREAPFYEFFFPHYLEPLSVDEIIKCMHALAEARGDVGTNVKTTLAQEPRRIAVLHRLTGGNPRVLTLIYRLLENAETNSVISDLESLLDQVTPYYKARVEEYTSAIQRKVIDTIALNWNPTTTNLLSKLTDISITTLPAQIKKLQNDGLIQVVPTSGKRSGYEFVERFFNIWYLMRHGTRRTKQRVQWLVAFFNDFYLPEDLHRIASDFKKQGQRNKFFQTALSTAIENSAFALLDRVEEKFLIRDEVMDQVDSSDRPGVQEPAARALVDKAITLGQLDRVEEKIAVYDEVIDRFGGHDSSDVQEQVARALVNKGVTLGQLDRVEEEIAIFDEVVDRYGTIDSPGVQEQVAWALINKGVTLGKQNRVEEGKAIFDEVLDQYGASASPEVQEQVARALINKGLALGRLHRAEEGIATFDEVVDRYGASNSSRAQQLVARALVDKGLALGQLERVEDQIVIYDEVVDQYSANNSPEVQAQVAGALINKGVTLGQHDRVEEGIAIFDEVVDQYGANASAGVQEQVAKALFNKGITLGKHNRVEEGIAIFDEVVDRYDASNSPGVQELVARALFNKGFTLGQHNRAEEGIAIYEEMLERYGASNSPGVKEQVARALVNKGLILGHLDSVEEKIAIYDEVVDRFGASDSPGVQEQIARALMAKGNIVADVTAQFKLAESAYIQAQNLLPQKNDYIADNLAWLYLANGRLDEAEKIRSNLISLPSPGPELLDAGIALLKENLGDSLEFLAQALNGDLQTDDANFTDDLYRLLRLFKARDYGEKFVDWFEESGKADKMAPIYAAFLAYVRGERILRDFNPEVRDAAVQIYDWLVGSGKEAEPQPEPKRKRGRPRKRSG